MIREDTAIILNDDSMVSSFGFERSLSTITAWVLILLLSYDKNTITYLELIEPLRRRHRNSRVLWRARIFQRFRSVKSWRKSLLEKLPFRALLHVLGRFGGFAHFFVCRLNNSKRISVNRWSH